MGYLLQSTNERVMQLGSHFPAEHDICFAPPGSETDHPLTPFPLGSFVKPHFAESGLFFVSFNWFKQDINLARNNMYLLYRLSFGRLMRNEFTSVKVVGAMMDCDYCEKYVQIFFSVAIVLGTK